MLNFDNDHIITGYIKQLLVSFNLPKYRVYTKENRIYHEMAVEYNATEEGKKHPVPLEHNIVSTIKKTSIDFPNNIRYAPYIKDGIIQYYVATKTTTNGKITWQHEWVPTQQVYSYNAKYLNNTKTLKITNNIYDNHTHEYLGEYLRFHRDYFDIDLMPLYNCFSNKLCPKLNYSFKLTSASTTKIEFNSTDKNYKIYMLPIKLFKNYTIAIDSDVPVELCCGIYGKYQDTRAKFNGLAQNTYKRFDTMAFNKPVLYTELNNLTNFIDEAAEAELAQNEQDLKLFIKLSASNNSSIVVLEGNYLNFNHTIINTDTAQWLSIIGSGDYAFNHGPALITTETTRDGDLFLLTKASQSSQDQISVYKFDKVENGSSDWIKQYSFPKTTTVTIDTNNPTIKSTDKLNDLYLDTNKKILYIRQVKSAILQHKQNHFVINFEVKDKQDILDVFTPITALQLLQLNTKVSYPFADRLIEYLTDNAITDTETNVDNIKRIQTALAYNNYTVNTFGVWDAWNKLYFYNYIVTNNAIMAENRDILGYVDKTIESMYKCKINNEWITLSGIDIYSNEEEN